MFDHFDCQVHSDESADRELFELMEDERAADEAELAAAQAADWADFERHLDEMEAAAAADQAACHSQMWDEFWAEVRENKNTWIK